LLRLEMLLHKSYSLIIRLVLLKQVETLSYY
jgi:hypothetical protein